MASVLEIIAKTEIAQHFKKRMVTGSVTYIFQVVMLAARTHTALAGCRPDVFALLTAQERVLKLHHPRIGKQQGRVVAWNQGT